MLGEGPLYEVDGEPLRKRNHEKAAEVTMLSLNASVTSQDNAIDQQRKDYVASTISYGNNSIDTCTNIDYLMKLHYLPVMYGTIFVVGILGNVTSLLVYLIKVRPWKSSSIILVNLATTDLLYMLSMPFLIYYYSQGDSWTLSDFMCRFVRFGFHFNLYGSILFLTCLAVFRYVGIVHPLQAARIQQKRWGLLACVLTWTLAAALLAPIFNMIFTVKENNITHCLDLASNEPSQVWWYSWMLTALGFLLPLLTVCLCYMRIAKELARGPHTQSRSRSRARKLIALIMICFVFCFFPFHVLRMLRIYTRLTPDSSCIIERWVHAVYVASRPVAALNIVFNLGLYTLAGDRFKQAFLRVSERTVHRRMTDYNLSVRAHYSTLSDEELDTLVSDVTSRMPHSGYRMVKGVLAAEGHRSPVQDDEDGLRCPKKIFRSRSKVNDAH
ncbi:2-oxoglutarate receptor 1-like [Salminus brasiliensis]|uniref:2-oxoglutarate receptor 1-like n=1 Tax=Salminus brasiliensis TaxID=930266 RepID=UPI003B82F1F2